MNDILVSGLYVAEAEGLTPAWSVKGRKQFSLGLSEQKK